MKVILKSKQNQHYAIGEYDDGKLSVLKGSKINPIIAFPQMSPMLVQMREDKHLVSEEGIVLSDIFFNSPSSAAQFVTGRSVNGLIAWRPNDEISLKEYLKKTN